MSRYHDIVGSWHDRYDRYDRKWSGIGDRSWRVRPVTCEQRRDKSSFSTRAAEPTKEELTEGRRKWKHVSARITATVPITATKADETNETTNIECARKQQQQSQIRAPTY